MIRILLACLCSLMLVSNVQAQRLNDGDRLWFSVTMEPDVIKSQGAYVGGEVVLHLRLVSPDSFQRLRLDLPEIEGARTETLIRPHMRQLSSLGSMGYSDQAGYSYEAHLSIVPERSGELLIPPIRVTGISQPSEGQPFEFQRTMPERTITVHPVSDEFTGEHWIVSRDVRMEQTWSPDLTSIRNGDTVRRSIVLTIAGIRADDLPALGLGAEEGYRVLSAGEMSETEKTVDGLVARLEQSWDIYVETEDVIHVDGFRIPYWNAETGRTEVAGLPRQRIEPWPEDVSALREQLRADMLAEHRAKSLGLVFVLSLPAAALLMFLAVLIWRIAPTRADLKFFRASRRVDTPRSFYASFLSWGRQALDVPTIVGQHHVSTLGNQATDHVKELHQDIFGRAAATCHPRQMASTLIKASRRRAASRFLASVRSGLSRFLFLC